MAFLCSLARGANPAHGATRAAGKYRGATPDYAAAARMHGDGLSVITGEIDSPATYQKLRVAQARLVFANSSDTVNTNIILTVREAALKVPVVGLVENEDSITSSREQLARQTCLSCLMNR